MEKVLGTILEETKACRAIVYKIGKSKTCATQNNLHSFKCVALSSTIEADILTPKSTIKEEEYSCHMFMEPLSILFRQGEFHFLIGGTTSLSKHLIATLTPIYQRLKIQKASYFLIDDTSFLSLHFCDSKPPVISKSKIDKYLKQLKQGFRWV
jgi:hypothetical protein